MIIKHKNMNDFLSTRQADFEGTVDFFRRDIASLRTGRANPAVLDNIQVEAYGVMNALNAVANISVSDARSISIAPWDKTVSKAIEKAIIEADLGLGVMNEGDKVRLTVPALTEENRRETVKKLNEKMEKARINIRQKREDVKNMIEKAMTNKEISEDDRFRAMKELDDYVAKKNDELKELRDRKEKDVMEI
ncbi:ribosome recycling factor [Candidatus Falkowbacteria bacterium HGW-Falkowbacteria-2]|uniref:Ribosome-recycling factor n=1 Tax=Candidatus Falkowbacteria bacterium HGW-Falkowbacteria-2 TaxID=2013769 RepID=A0A2N2DZE1_9BACT|nr:MAG: ribosome recycling factor [Candidatus Falkowbacteria bacterium HGW-Falkowbacteria-2]